MVQTMDSARVLDATLDLYYEAATPWERARIDRLLDDVPDLDQFIKAAWHVLEPETPLIWGWHLDAICDHLTALVDGQIQKLIINCPPSMSKSRMVGVFFPAWCWTFKPALRFLTGSYIAPLAIRDALASRRLLVSDWYQARWGHRFRLTGDMNMKCLAAGTLIAMASGELKPIELITRGDRVLSLRLSDEMLVEDTVCHSWMNGRRSIRRILLSDGTIIRATPEHRLFGWDDWIRVRDLKPGDSLAVARHWPEQFGDMTSDDAFLLALWLSEGAKTGSSYEITTTDPLIIERLWNIASERGWGIVPFGSYSYRVIVNRKQSGDTPLNVLKQWCGIHTKQTLKPGRARVRRFAVDDLVIPAGIFMAKNQVIAEFIGTYIACDGCVLHGKNHGIQITTVSEKLARGMVLLLKRFGVVSHLYKCAASYLAQGVRIACRDAWKVTLMAQNDVLCLSHIPLYGKNEQLATLVEYCHKQKRHRGSGRTATIPPDWNKNIPSTPSYKGHGGWAARRKVLAFAETNNYQQLIMKLRADLDWRRIIQIEDEDDVETYDLETNVTSMFFANGVLSHNSRYENDKTGLRVAINVGGATGEKGDIRILDDPHNIDGTDSPEQLAAACNWYRNTWSQRGNQADSQEVVIMQRLAKGDLSDFLLSEIGGFECLMMPMRFESDRRYVTVLGTDPRQVDGELLCPARFDETAVREKETTLGPRHAPGQLQQRPTARGGTVIRREWFGIVPAAPAGGRSVRGWDLGGSLTGNPSSGVKLTEVKGMFYVEHVVRLQGLAHEVEMALKTTASQDGIETGIDLPQDPGQAGKGQVAYLTGQLAGYTVQSSPESGSKEMRFEAFASQAAAGNVKLVEGPWNGAYLDELELLWHGDYDDQADATSRAFHRLVELTQVSGWYDEIA